jgi:HK97 family phage major capsid protein
MSDESKLLARLDEIDGGIKDYQKSVKADIDVAKHGVDEVKKNMEAQQKQIQDMAVLIKNGIPRGEREMAGEMGALILRAYRGHGVQKAASEGSDGAGGYLVNDDLRTNILSVQDQYGLARKVFAGAIVPMASDVTKIPVDTFEESGTVPVPEATSENAAISASDDADLSQVSLTAQKYATLNYVSNELIDDSFVNFLGAYLTPKLARQAAKIEDTVVFTTATTGLMNSANIQSVSMDAGETSFADVTFDNLLDMQDAVVDDALASGMYFAHRSVINKLRKVKGSDGQYIWTPAAGNEPAMILGYGYEKGTILPTMAQTAAAKGFILFGDPKLGAVFGERMQRKISASPEFRFNYDQVAIRMTFRIALGTNANIGRALCVLKTAAA